MNRNSSNIVRMPTHNQCTLVWVHLRRVDVYDYPQSYREGGWLSKRIGHP